MAKTNGHGNPNWTREETILALALYFECGQTVPSRSDPRLRKLSETLRALPYHAGNARKETFRNPDGVGFKLHNLRSVATGKGLKNTSHMDREIWLEFGAAPQQLQELAKMIEVTIRDHRVSSHVDLVIDDTPEEFYEGRLLTYMHNRRERHPGVRKALLKTRQRQGRMNCDLCFVTAPCVDRQQLEDVIFEAHHLIPIASALERKTQLRDMALVCANCHRLIHRLIANERRWLTLRECQRILRFDRSTTADEFGSST